MRVLWVVLGCQTNEIGGCVCVYHDGSWPGLDLVCCSSLSPPFESKQRRETDGRRAIS